MNTQRTVVLRSSSDLGFALREIRGDRGRTQAHVSASIGLDRSQLAHMEAGRSGRFVANLLAILDELGAQVSLSWAIADGDARSNVDDPAEELVKTNVSPGRSDAVAIRGSNAVGEHFRREEEAMRRVLDPILRQQEALLARMSGADDSP